MKILKYFLQSLIIYIFYLVILILGLYISRKLFSYLFNIFGPLIRSNKIIESNLLKINKNYKNSEIKKISKKMWNNYSKIFVEYIFLNKFKKQNKHIIIKNKDILDNLLTSKKPIIFVSGHFENFELMSMELIKNNFKLATIYRPLNNLFLNPFMEFLRKKYVCKNQIKKGRLGVKEAVKFIKNDHNIALMIDQRVSEGKILNFFNCPALTTTLPAQLAVKYNCDIVPIYIARQDNEIFVMEIYNPIKIPKEFDSEKLKEEISLNLNKVLESMIEKDPGQWILTHNRWK